jgi:pimeloyl-ACP methyl ester carboxylesterase
VLRDGTALLVDGMVGKLFSQQTQLQNRSVIEATRHVIAAAPRGGVAAALRGMARRVDATAWLPEIKLPTLVLCGQQDVISPPSEMQAIADAIANSTFAVIPAAGHMAPLECPIHVNKIVREFLGAVRRA